MQIPPEHWIRKKSTGFQQNTSLFLEKTCKEGKCEQLSSWPQSATSTLESFACWGEWSGGRKVESASHLCELTGTPPKCGHRAFLQSKYLFPKCISKTLYFQSPADFQKVPLHVYCFKQDEVWIRCQKVIWACPEVTWNLTWLFYLLWQ